MGIPFPVYSETDLASKSQQKRDALKTAIRALLQYDPDVKKLLEGGTDLKSLREYLQQRTTGLFK